MINSWIYFTTNYLIFFYSSAYINLVRFYYINIWLLFFEFWTLQLNRELYDVVGLLYPREDKSKVKLLDQYILYNIALESPKREWYIYV